MTHLYQWLSLGDPSVTCWLQLHLYGWFQFWWPICMAGFSFSDPAVWLASDWRPICMAGFSFGDPLVCLASVLVTHLYGWLQLWWPVCMVGFSLSDPSAWVVSALVTHLYGWIQPRIQPWWPTTLAHGTNGAQSVNWTSVTWNIGLPKILGNSWWVRTVCDTSVHLPCKMLQRA